jgi:hypothetical protein
MFKKLKQLFEAPSAEVIAIRELEDSKRKLLDAQTGREYANAMCAYYESKIKRLSNYVELNK